MPDTPSLTLARAFKCHDVTMISRVRAKNYRCYKSVDFKPNPAVNIFVGENGSGKSTLLEIIYLATMGRVRGRWAADDLNPHWFNREAVATFFSESGARTIDLLPVIELEVYFSNEDSTIARLRGIHNALGEDCAGLLMRIHPDPERRVELEAYLAETDIPPLVPTDLYAVEWLSFAGETISRQPRGLGAVMINESGVTNGAAVDHRLRRLLRDFVTPEESASIGLEHRRSKHEITEGVLSQVNTRIDDEGKSIGVRLEMDQGSNSSWDAMVSPHVDGIPFPMLGQGMQVAAKIELAMSRKQESSKFVMVEEPENHLSHTEMLRVLARLEYLAAGRQLFITTHSTFVLNRLGFDRLKLVHAAQVVPFNDEVISKETIAYFQKQPGYDTLRLAIAEKVVIVEGPSDEMIFNLAYLKTRGVEPRDNGIDVITLGTRGKRALELAKALRKKMAVLRDNDGKDPEHWRSQASAFLETGKRDLFVGGLAHGRTLENQMVRAGNEDALRRILSVEEGAPLEEAMLARKTDWAWKVAEAGADLNWPHYMISAIEFIDA